MTIITPIEIPDTPETTPEKGKSKGKKRQYYVDGDGDDCRPTSKKGKKGRKAPFGVSTGKAASQGSETEDGDVDDAEELPSRGSNGKVQIKAEPLDLLT